jgi:hypothetical protein
MTPRWLKPKHWRNWDDNLIPVFVGYAHHWDLYINPNAVYGVSRNSAMTKAKASCWLRDGYIRVTKPGPELIAKVNAMRMMLNG